MREIDFTRDSQADLMEHWTYLGERSGQAAARFSSQCGAQFDQLREFPNLGRRREELGAGLRSLPMDNYVIFYYVTETLLIISRALHGSRDRADVVFPAPGQIQ